MNFLLPAFISALQLIAAAHASVLWRGKPSSTTVASSRTPTAASSTSTSGLPTSAVSSSDRNIQLSLGNIDAGTYSFAVKIANGTLTEMTISDTSGKIYVSTYHGWAWGAVTYPQEMAFKVETQAQGTTFTAKSNSPDVQFTYDLTRANTSSALSSDAVLKGYMASFNKTSTRTPKLELGDLAVGTYSFAAVIFNGTLKEMAIVDAAGKVYGSTAPGWAWGVATHPQEMSFELGKPASGVRFVAVTASVDFAMAWKLVVKS